MLMANRGTVMTDDAFLSDIIENPDDDAPRLIYADWLDDNGDPDRAEFIRIQCALARDRNHPERSRLLRREAELRDKHASSWADPIPRFADHYQFRRGFVESMRMPVGRFLEKADEFFARQPIRLLASYHASAEQMKALARLPLMARLAVLNISSTMRGATFRTLIESPHLVGLRGLSVHDSPIGEEGLKALLDSPLAERLTHLDLSSTGIGANGVNTLASSGKLPALTALNLRGMGLSLETLRRLDTPLKNLRRLGLWYNRLGDSGLEQFVRLPLFARLRSLDMGYNRFTGRGARALAEAPALISLRALWLGVDNFTDDGVLAILTSPHLHPEAMVAFWFSNHIGEETKEQAQRLRGSLVQFERSLGLPEKDPPVGWPLWQPDRGMERG
jgi:uncharacterized protein (TIGR02996 family)